MNKTEAHLAKIEAFAVWAKQEYVKYQVGVTAKLIAYADALDSEEELERFTTYIKEHHNNAFDSTSEWDMELNALRIASILSGSAKEVLGQLVANPTDDGDVVSKCGKSELYHHGLAVRICVNGEHGCNAANFLGYKVWGYLNAKEDT